MRPQITCQCKFLVAQITGVRFITCKKNNKINTNPTKSCSYNLSWLLRYAYDNEFIKIRENKNGPRSTKKRRTVRATWFVKNLIGTIGFDQTFDGFCLPKTYQLESTILVERVWEAKRVLYFNVNELRVLSYGSKSIMHEFINYLW